MDDAELPPCDVLRKIHRDGYVELPDGERKRLTSGISPRHALTLYETVLSERPSVVVEVGMAQGVSTLSILCALERTGGRLVSVDPYVGWESGRLAALANVRRAGHADRHTHVEAMSHEALPRLVSEGLRVGLGYVDGSHAFEDVFIDFFYLDRMLAPGGVLAFNDAGWPDVHRVIRYFRAHRDYVAMDVGLAREYAGRNLLYSLVRRLLRRPREDRYFRKADAERS